MQVFFPHSKGSENYPEDNGQPLKILKERCCIITSFSKSHFGCCRQDALARGQQKGVFIGQVMAVGVERSELIHNISELK